MKNAFGVILAGAGPTALSALESLAVHCRVHAVLREPGGPEDPVGILARQLGVPVVEDLSARGIEAAIRDFDPQCVVISSYSRLLGAGLIAMRPFINVHYSPLPAYRGRANVNWAIINDEPSAAISIHTVVCGLDAGNLLFQRLIPIPGHATVSDLYGELNRIQKEHLGPTVCRFLSGYEGVPQSQADASYCCTRVPADGEIDWKNPTRAIYNLVRALQPPYPYAYSHIDCREFSIVHAQPVASPAVYVGRIPGRVVMVDRAAGAADVLTGDGILRISRISVAGGSPEPATALISSTKATLGLEARELLHRITELERQIEMLKARFERECTLVS